MFCFLVLFSYVCVFSIAGMLCNNQCPDELLVGRLTSNSWSLGAKISITILVVGMAVACMMVKLIYIIWQFWLEQKQDTYLNFLEKNTEDQKTMLVVNIIVL